MIHIAECYKAVIFFSMHSFALHLQFKYENNIYRAQSSTINFDILLGQRYRFHPDSVTSHKVNKLILIL